jgi:tetratricopeptide (TPR) repeat protein
MAEVLAEEPHPFGYWPETITLQVREPGGTVLGTAELQTTRPTGLDLVDMAQNGKPYIVVRSRTLAVSDHMAHLHVYRLDAQGLHLEGTFDGWLGSSSVGTREGRAVARIRYRYQHEWNDYLPIELITNPAPRLLRTLTIGWQDGHVGVVADEFTRLAYPLYGNTEIERPLRPEAVALWQKGEALLGAGKPAEAVAALQQALALEPLYPDALSSLSYAYARQGQWEESRASAAKAVELNPWHPFAQFNLGVALLQLGKVQEAERPLSTATGLQLDRWEPHYYLGLCYEQQGKPEKALTEYRKAVSTKPDAPEVQAALQRLSQ